MPDTAEDQKSPIASAIEAICDVLHFEGPGYTCVLDCDAPALEVLAGQLLSGNVINYRILFLVTPFRKSKYLPWIQLLESVIRFHDLGIICKFEDLVSAIRMDSENAAPSVLPVRLPVGEGSDAKLSITPFAELHTWEEVVAARSVLNNWAWLESYAELSHTPRFSRLVGGGRPQVVVFDDYNNYIQDKNSYFEPLPEDALKIVARYYFASAEEPAKEFYRVLAGFCKNLNNLMVAYDVRAPKIWVSAQGKPEYAHIAQVISLDELGRNRDSIAAFVVDLEWRPTMDIAPGTSASNLGAGWSNMGYRAIHLLAQYFPEIPSFVYTGERPYEKLQEALAYGAYWCFKKPESHHGSDPVQKERLSCIELDQHLQRAIKTMYGAFSELPYPDQLLIDPDREPDKALLEKLELTLPLEGDSRGRNLQRIVATLLPNGGSVRPVKVFGSGKSKAQATFVVRPEYDGVSFATRFLKVGSWLDIQREYLAYRKVIQPRLNTFVGAIVEKPVLVPANKGEMPIGAIAYSMAGLPEDFESLIPLHEMLQRHSLEALGGNAVAKRLRETLDKVLLHLHGGYASALRTARQPLWRWLGEVLPPVLTGVLVPLESEGPGDIEQKALRSWEQQGLKDKTAWLMAAREARAAHQSAKSVDRISPWQFDGEKISLRGFRLLEVDWNRSETGELTLSHPDLGFRVRLRGGCNDIRRRFGGSATRPGQPIDVSAVFEAKNSEFDKIENKLRLAFAREGLSGGIPSEGVDTTFMVRKLTELLGAAPLANPFEVFGAETGMPYSFTFSAHKSPVHGDLNLHNILFSGESGPGWLIDFDRASLEGMPAFDLAKLEAEIWHHHLFREIEQLCMNRRNEAVCRLTMLEKALIALERRVYCDEEFLSLVAEEPSISFCAREHLLAPICNLLTVIAEVRTFGRDRLRLYEDEIRWALAAYFFIATKFASDDQTWRAILSFYISARYVSVLVPPNEGTRSSREEILEEIVMGGAGPELDKRVDRLLRELADRPGNIDELTRAMARTGDLIRPVWDDDVNRWDLASTGSITNITPIMGYLWLMVKAHRSLKGGRFTDVVPKISSSGVSCGTVDILDSGGWTFPSDPTLVQKLCREQGGVLCKQDESLTPVDRMLMKRRKQTNTMKNFGLVYASVLAKKIAMGCTHAIVDVKVGRDTKLLAPWMEKGADELWLGTAAEELPVDEPRKHALLRPELGIKFIELLQSVSLFHGTDILLEEAGGWVSQACSDALSPVKEVRWFFTSADTPQCRAIGRYLMLLHLDDLVLQTYGDDLLESTAGGENEYTALYRKLLPEICGLEGGLDELAWEELQAQWLNLKRHLIHWDDFAITPLFIELKRRRASDPGRQGDAGLLSSNCFEQAQEVGSGELRMLTFALGNYQPAGLGETAVLVSRIDAWKLDALFDNLCGDNSMDPEVGFYLHRLPGERIDELDADPFISVCYRPRRTPERKLLREMRTFLSLHVAVKPG